MNLENVDISGKINSVNMDISVAYFAHLDNSWRCKNVCSPFTRMYIPTDGEGILKSGDDTIPLVKGKIYIIPAMHIFSYKCNEKLDKFYFHFSLVGEDKLDLFSKVKKILVLGDTEGYAERILHLFMQNTANSVIELKSLLLTLVNTAIKENDIFLGNTSNYSPTTKKALEYIEKNLRVTLTIDEISKAIFVSRIALQTNFKRDLNKTIGRYIDERVLIEGEKLVSENKLSIKEISDRLHFCDQFYFSRKFSEGYGISPQKHRKNIVLQQN